MSEINNQIVADEVATAHANVLAAIADNEGQEETAQQTFNEALSSMVGDANERLAAEIEARTGVESQLNEANEQIETLNARIAGLEQSNTELQATHDQYIEARSEEISELNDQIDRLNTQVSELTEANEKLSANTKPTPTDINDQIDDDDVAPPKALTGDQLYEKLQKKYSGTAN